MAITRDEQMRSLFQAEALTDDVTTLMRKEAKGDKLRTFVGAYTESAKPLSHVRRVVGKLGTDVHESLAKNCRADLCANFDILTIIQLLSRELKPDEKIVKLAAMCWKTINREAAPQMLLKALEEKIPKSALNILKRTPETIKKK